MKNNKRYLDSLSPQFTNDFTNDVRTVFLLSPTDQGIIRNGGRNGARFAPEAILNVFRKMINHFGDDKKIFFKVISNEQEEVEDFDRAQENSANHIYRIIKNGMAIDDTKRCLNLIHLGGGHDHAYPFLKSIEQFDQIKNILIINIDAHCDTRIDDIKHSGTPFRNFTDETNKKVFIVQYGIHNYANSNETLSPLKNAGEKHYSLFKAKTQSEAFTKWDETLLENLPFEISDETFIYLSLDCDAIESAVMEGVSAVNHDGIPISFIQIIIEKVKSLNAPKAFGVYEYNPIYDNQSQKGARAISSLIYNWLSQ